MYREPHLQRSRMSVATSLVWKELWDADKFGKESQRQERNGVSVLLNMK